MAFIEVDQSGKIEQTSVNTALGFSDGIQGAILIPASVKREVIGHLREQGAKRKMIHIRMFVAAVFLLLQEHLGEIDHVTIDTEYQGRQAEIKELLLQHIRALRPEFSVEDIAFKMIGNSAAHYVAWRTYRGERQPTRVIKAEELIKYC